MYQMFELVGRDQKIVGYRFDTKNPKHVVVLIHGIGEYAPRYDRMANMFSKEDIAIISMDLRGHGRTEGVRGHCAPRDTVLEDIDFLIDTAKKMYPNIPLILYGHSMGGGLVSDYRARGNRNGEVDGYIISAPWLKLVKSFPKPLLSIIGGISKITPELKISSACEEKDLGNLEYVRPYKDDPFVHPYITLLTAYEGFTIGESIYKGTNKDNHREDNIPTLLMHGTDDKICDVKGSRAFAKLNENNPNFTFVEWEGYYHEIHNGGPNGETGEEPIKKAIAFINEI